MTAAALPVLELRGVTVRFGAVAALSRVSTTLPAGEVTCVLGENGSGKSTLVALLSGLTRHTEGTLLDRYDVKSQTTSMARSTGYTCTAAVHLIAQKLFKETGVFPPEKVGRNQS